MHWGILATVFCLISNTECSNTGLRSHNNGPDWISDCYDHAPHHLMNPFCPTQGCYAPVAVAHAHMDYNITFYKAGSSVTYTCNPSYELVGPPTITCIQNPNESVYVWTPGPNCTKNVQECGPLLPFPNGKHAQTYNRTVNSTVAYTCNRGFKLIGPETVTCVLLNNQSTATWTERPSCVPDCGLPHTVMYANISDSNGTLEGDVTTYECQQNAVLVGEENVTCLHTGNWSEYPTCIPGCGMPPVVANGSPRAGFTMTVNSTTAYTCERGYRLIGEEIITCSFIAGKETPEWTTPPVCRPTDPKCPAIPTIGNGSAARVDSPKPTEPPTTTPIMTTATTATISTVTPEFNTTQEFNTTVMPDFNTTQDVNTTSDFTTTPYFTTTPDFTTMQDDTVTPDFTVTQDFNTTQDLNTTVSPTDAGTTVSGNESGTNTTATVDNETTTVVTTPGPNGFLLDKYDLGTSVTYQCNPGYTFNGSSSIVCKSNAVWSALPECVLLECGPPPPVSNGKHAETYNRSVNSTLAYTCDRGFKLSGPETVTCKLTINQSSATWTERPSCVPGACAEPRVSSGKFILGNLCNNSECFCDGSKCECGVETFYNNIDRICNETNEPAYRLVCNEKFRLVGDEFIQCKNSTWTAMPRCECIRKALDMVFIIDSSGSVGLDGLNQTKEFLIGMMHRFPANRTRFGLMLYSDKVAISFHLKTFINDTESMIELIRNISYEGGSTHTYDALQQARESMFTRQNGMRPNSSHIAILVSDGLSGDFNKTAEQGRLLKESGVTVYTVGVGDFTDNLEELKSVASREQYMFEVKNYENIDEVAGPLAEATCGASSEDEDEYPE